MLAHYDVNLSARPLDSVDYYMCIFVHVAINLNFQVSGIQVDIIGTCVYIVSQHNNIHKVLYFLW